MNRTCDKCGDGLVVNEKLGLMECVSGKHIEPINLVRPQWWNKCPKCGQMGVNDMDAERILQVFEKVEAEVNGKLQIVNKPVTKKIEGGKGLHNVFEVNQAQSPVTCRACGNVFTKKGAAN